MINRNDKLYLELQSSLRREREYQESNKHEVFFDDILRKQEYQNYVDIYYIYSTKGLNTIKFLNNKAIIVWDLHYWKCFEEYITQIENCKEYQNNIIQCIICTFTDFLSEKYQKIPEISYFLKQIKNNFGKDINLRPEKYKEINKILTISKCFAFFHELGHLEYRKNSNQKLIACKQLVLDFLAPIKKENCQDLGYWMDLSWETILAIRNGQLETIFEEIVADVFGMISLIDYFFPSNENENFNKACNIAIAIEYLATFQNLFNTINKAWDLHYPEMKFKLKPKSKNIDQYVNKLEIARNGLGNLMLVIVVYKILCLTKNDLEMLWEYKDNNHIDTESIIKCLADDEFICTAIQEALHNC